MAKTAVVLLVAIALTIGVIVAIETSPPLALKLVPIALKFGSLSLANLVGTSKEIGEQTITGEPATSSFSETPYPTYDDTIDMWASYDNYYITFTDKHNIVGSGKKTCI